MSGIPGMLVDMNETQQLVDNRDNLNRARAWVTELLGNVEPGQLSDPTPCSDYDVRALIEHLYAVVGKTIGMAQGHAAVDLPSSVPADADDLAGGHARLVEQASAAWADDASLATIVEAPFGRVPAAVMISAFVGETLTHGWDLAVATGQDAEADADLAEGALAGAQRVLAGGREELPFDEPVPPAAAAGPTERLANFMGRRSR